MLIPVLVCVSCHHESLPLFRFEQCRYQSVPRSLTYTPALPSTQVGTAIRYGLVSIGPVTSRLARPDSPLVIVWFKDQERTQTEQADTGQKQKKRCEETAEDHSAYFKVEAFKV